MNTESNLPMTDVCLHSYKAAISLSNIGISMLQRQCYSEATATFRDALELMRDAAPSDRQHQQDETRVNHLLQQASQRFAAVFSNDKDTERESSSIAVSMVYLSDDFTSDFVRTALNEPWPTYETVAIRIDDRTESDFDTRFQFDSAILLFNYATATRCLGAVTSPSNPVILQAAYKCYHMSLGVLSKLQSSKGLIDELQSIRVHLIAMMAVQHLASTAMELQLPEKAQEHYNLLCGLKAMYRRIERIPRMLNAAKSVAPAA